MIETETTFTLIVILLVALGTLGMSAAFHVGREIGREEAARRAAGRRPHGLTILRPRR